MHEDFADIPSPLPREANFSNSNSTTPLPTLPGSLAGLLDDDLETAPTENIEVSNHPINPQSKIESFEIVKKLHHYLKDGNDVWRSSKSLANRLGIDPADVDDFFRKMHTVVSRPGKEEGVFYYALMERLGDKEKKVQQESVAMTTRPLVIEEHRYAVAGLNNVRMLFEAVLKKYCMEIAAKSEEAFTNLVRARERLDAGLVLFATSIKTEMNKLP